MSKNKGQNTDHFLYTTELTKKNNLVIVRLLLFCDPGYTFHISDTEVSHGKKNKGDSRTASDSLVWLHSMGRDHSLRVNKDKITYRKKSFFLNLTKRFGGEFQNFLFRFPFSRVVSSLPHKNHNL